MNEGDLERAVNRTLGHIKMSSQLKEIGEIIGTEIQIREYAFDLYLIFDSFTYTYISNLNKFTNFVFGVFETREKIKGMFGDSDVLLGTKDDQLILNFCFRR